jgi:voltage-gated potassium channel Kch
MRRGGAQDRSISLVHPRLEQRLDRWSRRLTDRPFASAWRAIAAVTVAITIVGGVLVRLTDPDSISSVEDGFWWALQTITTVGYGDVVPTSVPGRMTAALVMFVGLSFLAVTTAAVTNAFVQAAAGRGSGHDAVLEEVKALRAEVAELRAALDAASARGERRP